MYNNFDFVYFMTKFDMLSGCRVITQTYLWFIFFCRKLGNEEKNKEQGNL